MRLVFGLKPAQNPNRVFRARLIHIHRLEPARKRRIPLNVTLIFTQGGGAYRVQLAPRERGLEHIGGVNRALGTSGADERMQLVDKNNKFSLSALNLAHDCFQPILKLAAVFGARDNRAKINGNQFFVFERLRHLARDDPLRKAFYNRCLADSGFTNQHRIVFGPARQHFHHAPDFCGAADHRIQLFLPGKPREIARVFLQHIIFGLRLRIRDALAAAQFLQGFEHQFFGNVLARQQFLGARRHFQKREEQMLGGDEFVFELCRLAMRLLNGLCQILRQIHLSQGACNHGAAGQGVERLQ